MRIIVSDSSCLIDLRKADLLEAFLELSYDLVVPDLLLEDELLSFSARQLSRIRAGMTVVSLEPPSVERVGEVLRASPALSTYDGFAFVVAEERPDSILLTGDRRLRTLAEAQEMEVHGVLWVVEELLEQKKASAKVLLEGLETWREDPATRLPRAALGRMISELKRKS